VLILRIKSGPEKGQSYSITEKPLVIGRDTADGGIQIFDQGASRQHAQVYKLGNMHFVKDLASRNGTFVNDDRITEEMLQVGDKIRIGHTIFVVDEATMKKATRPDEIESHHRAEPQGGDGAGGAREVRANRQAQQQGQRGRPP
jgi:pSer/pThr/pTyr-binding forkhead associated (FHA) protein